MRELLDVYGMVAFVKAWWDIIDQNNYCNNYYEFAYRKGSSKKFNAAKSLIVKNKPIIWPCVRLFCYLTTNKLFLFLSICNVILDHSWNFLVFPSFIILIVSSTNPKPIALHRNESKFLIEFLLDHVKKEASVKWTKNMREISSVST